MTLGKLTPHQANIFEQFCGQWRTAATLGLNGSAVLSTAIGSKTAMEHHLPGKGYIEIDRIERGPRGGERKWYRPTTEAHDSGAVRRALEARDAKRETRLAEG